ncbi:MAG: 1-acyl-sn-glycerol-3-phosphate acyltransferase [Sphingomonadaceae bacterium]|nr:1-acyl-sn-glycerol-3-phosphate acyltransferase [Sphingomonadaceae bacterium]
MVLWLIVCVPFHYPCKLITGRSPWPPRFLRGIAWIIGARVRCEGERLTGDAFFVSNHMSWMDIPIAGGATHAAFIAQDAIAGWPLIGWLARTNNTVFVSRGDRLGVNDQIAQVRAALAGHQPIVIFPEGTTSDGSGLLPFKPSLFAVLADPPRGIRVQPMLIDYGAAAPELVWVGAEPAPRNAFRMLARKGSFPVRLVFLEPFDPAATGGRKEIAARAQAAIGAAHSRSVMSTAIRAP